MMMEYCYVSHVSNSSRVVQVASGTPVEICGVEVCEDDYVVADNCGAGFVQAARIEEVLDVAERIWRRQEQMVRKVRSGSAVAEVMHDTEFDAINAPAPAVHNNSKTRSPSEEEEDAALVALFTDRDTAGVSNALDRLGIPGQVSGVKPIAGPAFTVRYVPVSSDPAACGNVGDFLDDVRPGDFIVIDNAGRTDCTVWGDILTSQALGRGVAGTAIDGACRDVVAARPYLVFARGRWMRTGKDRVQLAAVGKAVGLGGARVEPGDVVVADADGVVVVPRARAREVAALARGIEEAERGVREMLVAGSSLAEARAKMGYHGLQRKEQGNGRL
ncbi:hypothetical protein MY10362_001286 [Beauveria mimosiformis]